MVETDAGVGSGFSNEAYKEVGAELVATPKEIFKRADMVMHVKEIQFGEYALLREGQIVFTYLHLAADPEQTAALQASKCVAIAYETVQTADKRLPLLQPMSEVAGRMAIQEGARFLEMSQGGNGVLLGGVPGVAPAKVVILGGGVVGTNAAKIACGMGADVTVLDMNLDRLRYLDDIMPANCKVIMSNPYVIQEEIKQADLVIGAVLVAGAKAPKLVTKEMIAKMKKGAVMVDVAIDQGGCFETSRPTTHQDPVFTIEGVIQYCVANMPGAVARTSTLALTNATLPYALAIADKGWKKALEEDKALALGLNVVGGEIVFAPVKEALGLV
ncbi:Alanine dehydrogenase [termite gut metagenome]|uniref:alanine dehydrogenase n=1 Tax=termite gut metagenome TaxID=433724 RepID=A0A5J4RQK9_9ZZZZ